MSLPALSNWTATRIGLHQAAQVVGTISRSVAHPLPNWLHLTLHITPQGLTTGPLPIGCEVILDFTQRAIVYTGSQTVRISLVGHSQTSLADTLLAVLDGGGHSLTPDRSKISGNTPFAIDAQTAEDYGWALHRAHVGLARFRANIHGWMSSIGVWPHGFDAAFLWFPGGHDEGKDPHMNFGFSPGSAGFERPYFYAYAHPIPAGMLDVALPPLAHWVTQPWTGVVVNYDDLIGESDIEGTLERTFTAVHAAIAPLVAGLAK